MMQTQEKMHYKLVENAGAVFIYLDTGGNISLCNKKLEEITGKERDDIIGKFWGAVLFSGDTSPIKRQMFKAVIDDAVTYMRLNSFEGVMKDAGGEERFISWSITPNFTDSGKLEGVLLIGNDTSALKANEAALKNIDETLKNIFANIKEYALFVINLDGNITYYGMGSEAMFGWKKNEIIFKHVNTLFSQLEMREKLEVILRETKASGCYEIEMDMPRQNAETFPVYLNINQFLDTGGKIKGFIFIAKDITERKRLEYQIFQSEKLAAIGQLAAGMAHEINNPLFVISGRLEIILDDPGLGEDLKNQLHIISGQADRIRKLVDSLLMYSRQSKLKLEPVSVNSAIESILPFLAYHKLPGAKIEIEKYFSDVLADVRADLNQLQEVFLNLLINAHQAMPAGGKVTVKTSDYLGQGAEIRISDTGEGISAQNLKNVFLPFFSTKKEGTGLGLSICYNIIKNHGGSINVESELGKGTTFIIRLPFVK